MKRIGQIVRHSAVLLAVCILGLAPTGAAQAFSTTTVQGTVYGAGGEPVSGTLQITWPAFTTSAGHAVAAGLTPVSIGADGFFSVNLAPNIGAMPAGLYYTAIYHLSDGTTSTEYWVIPAAAQATLAQVRAQVMPAAQAVQAVNKAYVDQTVQEALQGQLTAFGGTLTGPLYLSGDPTQPTQATDKHYVDDAVAGALPLDGGVLTGPVTGPRIGAVYQADQFAGADFGARLQACIAGLNASYGGTCDARNFSGALTMASNLTVNVANATIYLPCSTISTAASIVIPAGVRNVTLHGCASEGSSAASGSQGGTVILYSGSGAAIQVGDSTYASDTPGFHLDNAVVNTTAATASTAQAIKIWRTQELALSGLYLLGNANQTAITLDGTGNYTGGSIEESHISGFQMAVNAIGHQVANPATTDWVNASTFVRLHIDCPTTSGNPQAGTFGINLQQGDGNTFTGGDVEGCSTALHLGANAQNNTLVGLRNENSSYQVVADAGSSYNNWITGGTMYTGKLTDGGTHNSFLDTFHRSFNGLNGDLYRSQADATVTNHVYLGIGIGNVRGRQDEYITDVPGQPGSYQNAWLWGPQDGGSGQQTWALQDMLNNVPRFGVQQNTAAGGNPQTYLNAAGGGSVCFNCSANAGTGGVNFSSGGASPATVATVDPSGNAQFTGTLQVGGTSQSTGTMTVRNNVDAEVDYYLWPGLTASQKGSFTYKDFNGNSQWYLVKDASNNLAVNSAVGGLDSFKAYQSTNSGDTYIDSSNATGHIRLNYEAGAGAETDIYSGGSANLAAAFLSPTSIKLPGLAAASGHNCVQIDNSGYLTNSGAACGSGGGTNGTVNSGTSGQIAYYGASGTAISGTSAVPVSSGGTGATTASGALGNLLPGVNADGNSGVVVQGGAKVSGSLSAASVSGSVNGVFNVVAYGAKGDCVGQGSAASCTDNTAAIQNAINAAYAVGGAVYFPTNPSASGQTVYYIAGTVNPEGVSMFGPPGAQGGRGYYTTYATVVVRGAPGKDVFDEPDPILISGGALPLQTFTVRDLTILVDDSTNATTLAPRTCSDGAMASGSATLTSPSQCGFQRADVGRPITIAGAGASGASLTTMVTGYNSATSVTVAATASATVSGKAVSITQSFRNRLPGRTVYDGAMTALANPPVLTSSTAEFQPGDVGQNISVGGAGPSGAALVTTIASYTSATSVTLSAGASTTVSGGRVYIAVDNLPVTQTVGNCGFAYDDSTASTGSADSLAIYSSIFENVRVDVVDNSPWINPTCGFFFQGNYSAQTIRWSHDTVGGEFPFVFVPENTVQPNSTMWTGMGDYNTFDQLYIAGSYSFISYDGGFNTMRDIQFGAVLYGPQMVQAYGLETFDSQWHIDLPEMESANNPVGCSSTTPSIFFRLSGWGHVVTELQDAICPPSQGGGGTVLQWDANRSQLMSLTLDNDETVNISGNLNKFLVAFSNAGANDLPTFNVTGLGNRWETTSLAQPANSNTVARDQFAGMGSLYYQSLISSLTGGVVTVTDGPGSPQLSRGAVALNRDHDFIDKGATTPYFNGEDLWIWPGEATNNGPTIPTAADTSSETGLAWQIGAASGYNMIGLDGVNTYWGLQFPAGKVRFYVKAKANNSAVAWSANIAEHKTAWDTLCTVSMTLTTSYQVGYCDADASAYTGSPAYLSFAAAGTNNTVSVAWVALRPWDTGDIDVSLQVGQSGTPMTTSGGSGGVAQETTSAAKTAGDAASYDAYGNVVDSGLAAGTATSLAATPSQCGSGQYATGVAASGNANCGQVAYAQVSGTPASLAPSGTASGDLIGSYPGPTVAKVNGASVPASANGLASNSSSQLVAQTAHNQSALAGCTTTNSGNAYTCTTAPSFTAAAGDQVLVKFNAANTGTATLNVNGGGAVTIYKWGNTAGLASGDIQASHYIRATYDGSHWQLEGQLGNANATQVNGAAAPVSKTIVGTNSSGQVVDASTATLANNTTGSAGSLVNSQPASYSATFGYGTATWYTVATAGSGPTGTNTSAVGQMTLLVYAPVGAPFQVVNLWFAVTDSGCYVNGTSSGYAMITKARCSYTAASPYQAQIDVYTAVGPSLTVTGYYSGGMTAVMTGTGNVAALSSPATPAQVTLPMVTQGPATGTITGSGTSGSHTFSGAFSGTPSCTAAPTSNAGAFYISAESATAMTITYATSGAQTFAVQCLGQGGSW